MKLTSRHLLIILLVVLLGCSIFTCNMVEGLSGMNNSGKKKDIPVNPETLQPMPYDPLATSRPVPSPKSGMPPGPYGFDPAAVTSLMPNTTMDGYTVPFESGSPAASANATTAPISSALPKGIPFSEIPEGDEDLYIKKSEVVPPVCPVCPAVAEIPREKPCPPCPACERCPEPAFECKKVPNYSSRRGGNGSGGVDGFLPRPVLADFSSFGM
jgi:hypothetical protein